MKGRKLANSERSPQKWTLQSLVSFRTDWVYQAPFAKKDSGLALNILTEKTFMRDTF